MKIRTVLIAKRISKVIESNGHLRMTFYDYLPKYIWKWFEAFGPLRYLNYIYHSTKHKCENKSEQFVVALQLFGETL